MAEYFDISLIGEKTDSSKPVLKKFLLEKFGLTEGLNTLPLFDNKNVKMYFAEDSSNFDEVTIGIEGYAIKKEQFDDKMDKIKEFINICFENCILLQFAVCSFEINGYLLSKVNDIGSFNDSLLNKFPISFRRVSDKRRPELLINLNAQDIFD